MAPEQRDGEEALDASEHDEGLEEALELEDYEDLGIPESQVEEPQGEPALPHSPEITAD